MFPTCKDSQKQVKNQKSTDKHLPFDFLIQEDIDLSDIYLAVLCRETYKTKKKQIPKKCYLLSRSGEWSKELNNKQQPSNYFNGFRINGGIFMEK